MLYVSIMICIHVISMCNVLKNTHTQGVITSVGNHAHCNAVLRSMISGNAQHSSNTTVTKQRLLAASHILRYGERADMFLVLRMVVAWRAL